MPQQADSPRSNLALQMVDGAADAFVALDPNFRVAFANSAAERLLGLKESAPTVRSLWELLPAWAGTPVEESLRRAMSERLAAGLEHFDDRLRKWLDISTTPSEDGGLVVRVQEITERRSAEETARAERRRFSDVLDQLPAYLILLSQDYHVPFANRFFRERFGESHGQRCFEYLFQRTQPCENCETYTVLQTNAPHRWEWTGPDGRNYDIYDFPFTDADGSTMIMEAGIDITERKHAEAELVRHREHLEALVEERTSDLRASEARLRLAQVSAGAGMWDWDMSTGKLEWSDELFRLFGLDAGKTNATFDSWKSAIHPDDRLPAEQRIQDAVSRRTALASEYRIVLPCGEVRWIHALGNTICDETGKPQRMSGICIDITDRKRAEEDLSRNREWLRVTLNSIGDAVLATDTEGRITFVNPVAAQLTGFAPEEALGQPVRGVLRVIDETTRREVDDIVQQVLLEGRVVSMANHAALVTRDGREIPIEDSAAPIRDAAGGVAGAVVVFHDVTAKRRAQSALAAAHAEALNQKNRLSAVMETLPVGVALIDSQGGNVGSNRMFEQVWGTPLPPTHSVGDYAAYQAWWTATGRPVQPEEWASARAVQMGETVVNQEIEIQRFDGTRAFVLNSAAPIRDAQGRTTGSAVAIMDITERKRTEAEIERLAQQRQIALDAARMGWWRYDPITRIAQWDDRSKEILGIEVYQRALEEVVTRIIHPADRPGLWSEVEAALDPNNPQPLTAEYRIHRSDGSLRWIEAHGIASFEGIGEERKATSFVGTVADITERKKAEQRLALRNAATAVLADARTVEVAAPRLLEVICDRLGWLGAELWLADTTAQRLRRLCFWEAPGAGLADILTQGASLEFGRGEGVPGRVWASGEPLWVADITVLQEFPRSVAARKAGIESLFAFPIRLGTETIGVALFAATAAFAPDASLIQTAEVIGSQFGQFIQRKQAEEALRASEERLSRAQQIAHVGSWELDVVHNRLTWSDEVYRIVGLEPQEFRATYETFLEAVHPEDRAAVAAAFSESQRESRGAFELEFRVVRRTTGETRFVQARYKNTRDAAGRTIRSEGTIHDITERKQAEERLRHAQKLESIGILAGGIAHDFNNLLTSILGNASLLETREAAGNGEQLRAIIEASEKAAALTTQLLAYAGKGQFEIGDFDIARLVRSSADLLRISIPKNAAVELDVPRRLPVVRGDASQIQQVMMNLVINAAEAIENRTDGKVSIAAGSRQIDSVAAARIASGLAPGRYAWITVRDNGCGMDEATKANIFDPFFSTKFTGRGLGLAAVQGIVSSHKGAITVDSAPGQGSSFTLYIPCRESRVGRTAPKSTAEAGRKNACVLVVDDEESVRAFTKAGLERLGYRVLLAENGHQALEVLERNRGADLVVLDLVMPVMSGGEVLSEIRTKWPNLAILVATGYNRQEALRMGVPRDLPFIGKPYRFQALAAAVDNALKESARDGK